LLARVSLPLTLVVILAACGGSKTATTEPTQGVRGEGFTIAVPEGWHVSRSTRSVVAVKGSSRLSVTTFTLLKPYDPARFEAAAKELDGVAARLAAQAGGRLTESMTSVVAGRKTRSYRFVSKGMPTRIGFVLVGKDEYQLVCSGDTGSPCDLLFSSFTVS
jgi:hypothetical protein